MVGEKSVSGPIGPSQCRQPAVLQAPYDGVGVATAEEHRLGARVCRALEDLHEPWMDGSLQGVKPKETMG